MGDDTEAASQDDGAALTGATIDGPTSGVSVGGAGGRLVGDAGTGEAASDAASPGVVAERERIEASEREAEDTPPGHRAAPGAG